MFGIPQGRPHGDSDNQAGRGAAFALYGTSAAAALFTGAASGRPYLGESAASLYSLSIPSDLLPPMNVMGGQLCLLTYPSADRLLVCPIHPLRFYPESAILLLYSIGFCHPVRASSSSAWDPVIASYPYPVGPPPWFRRFRRFSPSMLPPQFRPAANMRTAAVRKSFIISPRRRANIG